MESNLSLPDQIVALCADPSTNSSSELWLLQDRTSGLVTAIFLLLLLVIGLPLTLLTLATIFAKKLYREGIFVLMINYFSADMVIMLLIMPFQIITGLTGVYAPGISSDYSKCILCDFGVVFHMMIMVTVFGTTLATFDRFLFFYKPLKYERLVTCGRLTVAVVLVWILSFVVAVLPLTGISNITFSPHTLSCFVDVSGTGSLAYTWISVIVFIIPIVLKVVFTIGITVIALRHIRAIYWVQGTIGNTGASDTHNLEKLMRKKYHEKILHLAKVHGFILFTNAVLYMPVIILLIIFSISQDFNLLPFQFGSAASVLFMAQVVCTPIMVTVLIKEVRDPIVGVVCVLSSAKATNTTQAEASLPDQDKSKVSALW